MALADYCLCSVCGGKTFYDADTHWWECARLGALVALCSECVKTHDVKIISKAEQKELACTSGLWSTISTG